MTHSGSKLERWDAHTNNAVLIPLLLDDPLWVMEILSAQTCFTLS